MRPFLVVLCRLTGSVSRLTPCYEKPYLYWQTTTSTEGRPPLDTVFGWCKCTCVWKTRWSPTKDVLFFWCMMCDVWCMIYGPWVLTCDIWYDILLPQTHTYAYIDIHICLLSIYDRSYTIFANLLPWLQEGHNHQFRIFAVTQNQPVQKLPVPGSIHSHYFHIRGWSSTQ